MPQNKSTIHCALPRATVSKDNCNVSNAVTECDNPEFHSTYSYSDMSNHYLTTSQMCFLVAKILWKTICSTDFLLQNRGSVIKIKNQNLIQLDQESMIFRKWHHYNLSNSTAAMYFLSAEMHSYTTNGSHSLRWKEMVASKLT